MTCRRQDGGFTLIEVVIVLGVLGLLLGSAMPLATAMMDADKRAEVRAELTAIGAALEAYYFDRAAWPATLTDAGFLNVYLQPGTGDTGVQDSWGGNVNYVYAVNAGANMVTVHSRGENGIDSGVANEEFVVRVYGAAPGLQKTRQRLRVIAEALANFVEAGGSLTGTWSTDRAAMGLGAEYANDGFGVAFQITAATLTVRSAGPDRVMGNADDLTL